MCTMVFYTDFGLSSGRIEGVHGDTANLGKKNANVPKPKTSLWVLLCCFSPKTLFVLRNKWLKGNSFLTFPLPVGKPVNSLFVAPAVTPVKNVLQLESNNPGVRLYQYDLLDYSLLVGKGFRALFNVIKNYSEMPAFLVFGYCWNFGAYSYFSSRAKERKFERELGQSLWVCGTTHYFLFSMKYSYDVESKTVRSFLGGIQNYLEELCRC